ncbi:transcriptional regulator [Xenorhabdus sp. PB30.3]|uniref:transcriptional regulator n=1 Tax=Xenorhabdus sp. PB30.3 TaxID=2788941 RepID=UPI001E5106A5|nr:transcriptional regulator [Xenorhabdus sp. PB30.3]MCC8380806.1 transcriptional regulator [Xenorhabdus sp. PB30.3]
MSIIEKLKTIELAEKIDLSHLVQMESTLSWFSLSAILNQKKVGKYTTWFVTGKIAPEAGQISPAIAHSGHAKIMLLF